MQKFFDSVIDLKGKALAGASITVNENGGGIAAIYDRNGNPATNPFSTDPTGYFEFYAADGHYDIVIEAPNFDTRTITDIILDDPSTIDDLDPGLQDAIDAATGVVQDALDAHIADATTAHAATAIANTPAGNIAATNVQAAINELDTEKQAALGFTAVPNTRTVNGHALSADVTVSKSDVGLGNVDNTSDANKPVSTAQAAADAAVLAASETYADGLVVGLWDDRGNFNASGNTFPASGGSGTAGAIKKGDIWTVSVAGTLGGHAVTAGDVVRALTDTPGQTDGNWAIEENNIGYVPENSANKDASGGYPGLTLFKLNLRNAANTITSWFTTAATVARTWTLPDKDGTVAMTSDITGTNSGTNTGDETGARVATLLHAASAKSALVDADEVNGTDSANSFSLIRTTWTSVKAFLKTYFDTLYQSLANLSTNTSLGSSDTLYPSQNAVKVYADAGDAATLASANAYTDAFSQGLSIKASVRLATAAALPANVYANGSSGVGATITALALGALTVDGVAVALNDRILVKDEGAALENGIYKCTVLGSAGVLFVLTRVTDMDQTGEFAGAFTFVEAGTANAGSGFVCSNTTAPTVGTTAINFTQFSGAGEITAGTGLSKSGNTLSLSTPVSVANGGTNSVTPLNSNRVMISSSGAVVEQSALTASKPMRTDGSGLPTTGNTSLTTDVSGTLQAAQMPALTGDVTTAGASLATTLANVPSGTPHAGSSLVTAIAAPGTPAAGKASVYVDSTSKALASKNDAGTVSHTVQSKAAVSHNFLTAIADDGTVSSAQPSVSDVSGAAASGANTDLTSILLNQTGLVVKGASSNALTIKPNETLSAGRTLNVKVNDVDRTIDLSGNLTVSAAATVSGTNTGDQTITLTGDVTGSGPSSFAATIANDAVTYAKMQNVSATSRLIGRVTAGAGDPEEVVLDTDGTLAANSDSRVATEKAVKTYVDAQIVSASGVSDVQTFTSSGANTWTKPAGFAAGSRVLVQLWGAGGSGGRDTDGTAGGGGGGSYKAFWKILSDLGGTETATVGAGGAAKTTTGNGNNGGSSTFGSYGTGYGGSGGGQNTSGGSAGGWAATSAAATGTNDIPTGEGVGGSTTVAATAGYFTGGGGGALTGAAANNVGGNSVYGGGGGGGKGSGSALAAGGTSEFAGGGGASSTTGNSAGGTAPSGGGGSNGSSFNSGAGADGKIVITVFR